MAIQLFQATASQEVPLGPFISDTDGKTAMPSLTIANTDIKIWKPGASALVNKNSGGATHMANGVYYTTLDATDTSSLGPLLIFVHMSGALPVRVECYVEDQNAYYKQFNWFRMMVAAQATGTPTTTTIPITLVYPTAAASSQSGTYVGMLAVSLTGGGAPAGGAVTRVAAYNGATQTLTVDPPFPVAIGAGELLLLVPGAPGVLADNAVTAAKVSADAVTELQAGLATSAALATVNAYVDELESRLTAARAGYLDNLSGGAVATAAALAAVSGLVDDLESRLTAARAGYLDSLNTGVPLSAAAVDAILDDIVEGTLSLRQAQRLMLAALAGKASGGGTSSVAFRDLADTKNRIVMTTDTNGNRTAVTRDAT
jgi:hypothetical protein